MQVNSRLLLREQSNQCADLIPVLINISEYVYIFEYTFCMLQVLELISTLRAAVTRSRLPV